METITWKGSENVGWQEQSAFIWRSENIVALYKSEQGLIIERAVGLNSTSLEAKRVRMFQTGYMLFIFFFSFLLSLFILFFNTTSPFAIGSTKNCGTCTALFMTHRLLPLCLANRWIKTFPSRAISDVRSLPLSIFLRHHYSSPSMLDEVYIVVIVHCV